MSNCMLAILVVLLLAGVFAALSAIDAWMCHARWNQSGMAVSYGPIQGCLIHYHGKWIPERNYREFQ